MKFECLSSITFFKEKTTLSHIPTTIEPNTWFIPVVMLYGENYIGKGLWMVTKKPTEPKLMEEIGEELHLYDTTVAFHCRLQKDDYREWLVSSHPRLNNFRPIDLLKEDAEYESTTGAIALKKLLEQEIESLSLESSSLPS